MWLPLLFVGALLVVDGATQPFVTTWRTSSANENITLPVYSSAPSLFVDWGDSKNETLISISGPITHNYSAAGYYNVSILGDLSGFRFNFQGDTNKIVDIVSWGDGFFMDGNSDYAFAGCTNLRVSAPASSQPVFLPLATLWGMFARTAINSALNWNLTNVVSLREMFIDAPQMNQPVNFFNMGQVNSLASMFRNATSFNQPVNFTDTNSLASMEFMFLGARSFNQTVNVNASQVTQMGSMFREAASFNQPVRFDTRNVQDMSSMFYQATSFNQTVNFSDTSKVTTMYAMFYDARSFNQPVRFDTRSVQDMSSMFYQATRFNQPISWEVGQLTTAANMFRGATSFNQPVTFSNVTRLWFVSGMFANVHKCFNQTVNISTTTVAEMQEMFLNVPGFQQDLGGWDTSAVQVCADFCPQCGLPSFTLCGSPCSSAIIVIEQNAKNVSVCNLPTKPVCGPDLCTLVRAPPSLQVECVSDADNEPFGPSAATVSGGGVQISPLFNITYKDGEANSTVVFTLPIDPVLYETEIGKVSQACYGGELSCEWQDPTSLEFQQSGCAVSRENVDLGSGVVGTECTCTHLTVFAIVLRSRLHLAPLCHAQEIDYALLALYAALACVLILQTGRVLYHKLHKTACSLLLQHLLLLLSCMLRVVYLVLKPMVSSLAGLVVLGLLPSAIALTLFIHLLLVWASLQLSLQTSPFERFRKPFLAITVLVFVLVVVLVVLVAVQPDVVIVQGGSYAFAILSLIVCVLVLVSGLGLRRSLGKLIAASASSSSSTSSTSSSTGAPSWRRLLRFRVRVATFGLSLCLLVVACLWVATVQTEIVLSSAATLTTTASFYVFDWLSLCVMTWLSSKGIKAAVKKPDSQR